MTGIIDFIRSLFSSSTETSKPESQMERIDGEEIIKGTASKQGVLTIRDDLMDWQAKYTEEYQDFLTVEEALKNYQRAQNALNRLSPILKYPRQFDADIVDAAETLNRDITNVCKFIKARDAYNKEWLSVMQGSYSAELNSYYKENDITLTDQQFRAIFSNDNFNRVNAAAGTGKTTTFGQRVNFILSEYDDVPESDLLGLTFTRNGVSEMKEELEETFDITGIEVNTINSYSKSVAEDHNEDLEFIVGEAKTTEIASIWREIKSSEKHETAYDEFLKAWKESKYDPNDFSVIEGVYNALSEKSGINLGGEEVPMDSIPEEGLAHEAIASFLMEHQLKYDYQVHLEWAHSASDDYVLDFRLIDIPTSEKIYIEYCTSETTREERPGYRNMDSERPETIRRIFEPNEKLDTDTSDKTGIVIDGDEILNKKSDKINWDDPATREKFKQDVKKTLAEKLQETSLDLEESLSGEELMEYVYDHKVLTRDILENVEEFISQARVRGWSPKKATIKVNEYIETTDDIERGVPEFCYLCLKAYEKFCEVFDNEEKTDFHGSIVLTNRLLKSGKVDERFLYKYIFIDEMQDLNQVQFELIKELAEQKNDVRVFGVGDDWQSIFGFRGARPDLFINYGDVLEADDYDGLPDPVTVFTDYNPLLSNYKAFADTQLEENFRCPDTIVTASNAFIRNNKIRTDKDPSGLSGGDLINVHHLGCDTYEYKRNISMRRKIEQIVSHSKHPLEEIQILLRQQDGDPKFYYSLKKALPDEVDIRTAHDAKGSEAEHVIIPKVSKIGGYPSMKPNRWLAPVKQPPSIYEEKNATYQLEEERRLFYVALTRTKTRLDVLTVQGAESIFIGELPDQLCRHYRPLADDELEEIETNYECRKTITGSVYSIRRKNYATLDWEGHGLIDINLYDATDEQLQCIKKLNGNGAEVTFKNCGIQYRDPPNEDDPDYKRLQLQIDEEVTIEA